MKDVFIVIGYDSIFNGEEVCAVFYNIYKAEAYREKEGKMRVEHHIVKDAPQQDNSADEDCDVYGCFKLAAVKYCEDCAKDIGRR